MSRQGKWLVVSVFTATVAITVGIYIVVTNRSESISLKDLLSYQGCQQPCWQGLEPDVTSVTALKMFLSDNAIIFTTEKAGVEDIYTWRIGKDSRLGSEGYITVSVRNDRVVGIIISPLDVCVSSVVSAYGVPSRVTGSPDYLELLYRDPPLIFHVSSVDPTHVSAVRMAPDDVLQFFWENPFEKAWSDVFSTFLAQCSDRVTGR